MNARIHLSFSKIIFTTISGIACVACRPDALQELLPSRLQLAGATVAHVHRRGAGYGSGSTAPLYRHLKSLGYNSIQLNTFAYQQSNHSTTLRWDDPTLTGADLTAEIRAAHAAGLSVLLKPHVWVGGFDISGNTAETQWRSKIQFSDAESQAADRWFAAYAKFILPQAELAARENVHAFAVGTELVGLTHNRHTIRWQQLIRAVRARYPGQLTYACEAWNASRIAFWDELDAIGLDFYYGYEKENPTRAELSEHYRQKLLAHHRHAGSLGKALWLTEVGFPSHELAVQKPHAWPDPQLRAAPELQEFAYQALADALPGTEPAYPAGIWIWKYTSALEGSGHEARVYARGFHVQNKPAEAVIRRMFLEAPR